MARSRQTWTQPDVPFRSQDRRRADPSSYSRPCAVDDLADKTTSQGASTMDMANQCPARTMGLDPAHGCLAHNSDGCSRMGVSDSSDSGTDGAWTGAIANALSDRLKSLRDWKDPGAESGNASDITTAGSSFGRRLYRISA